MFLPQSCEDVLRPCKLNTVTGRRQFAELLLKPHPERRRNLFLYMCSTVYEDDLFCHPASHPTFKDKDTLYLSEIVFSKIILASS